MNREKLSIVNICDSNNSVARYDTQKEALMYEFWKKYAINLFIPITMNTRNIYIYIFA